MSGRNLSAAFLAFLHARNRADGTTLLLRILHADLGTLRFVCDGQDLVAGGETYEARSFKLPLPTDEDGLQETSLDLDVVTMDDDLVEDILEASADRPTVEVDVVRLRDPDVVETTFYFEMKNAVADDKVLRAQLLYEPVLSDPYPGDIFDGARFPDMFE